MSKLFDKKFELHMTVFHQQRQQQQRKLRTITPRRTHILYTKIGGHITTVMTKINGRYRMASPNMYIIPNGSSRYRPTMFLMVCVVAIFPITNLPRMLPIFTAVAIGEIPIMIRSNKTQQRMHCGISVIPLQPNMLSGEK